MLVGDQAEKAGTWIFKVVSAKQTLVIQRSLLALDVSLSIQNTWKLVSTLRKSRTYNTSMTVSQISAAFMSNIKSEACNCLWELRTGKWGDLHFCQWVSQVFIMQSGLVRWWSSVQAQVLQGNVFSGHRSLISKHDSSAARFLLPLHLSCSHLSHTYFCCMPSSLCFPTGSLFQMLPLPTASRFLTLPFHLPFRGSWWLLCFSSQFSAASCSWPLCSASPQMLGLQLPFPVLSTMNFSTDFFCSPA